MGDENNPYKPISRIRRRIDRTPEQALEIRVQQRMALLEDQLVTMQAQIEDLSRNLRALSYWTGQIVHAVERYQAEALFLSTENDGATVALREFLRVVGEQGVRADQFGYLYGVFQDSFQRGRNL